MELTAQGARAGSLKKGTEPDRPNSPLLWLSSFSLALRADVMLVSKIRL